MKKLFIQIFYNVLFLPLAMLRILFKSYKNPEYLARMQERFAIFDLKVANIDIWVHTVSVGEFIAARALLLKLINNNPEIKLLITTTTPTGSQMVQDFINNKQSDNHIYHLYFPYDVTFICRKFLTKIKPKQAVFFETEIWPNMFNAIKKQGNKN